MASKQHEARSLMDEFLPNHDFSAAYEISINAPASVVSECLLHLDFNELWLVRLLMSIRSGKWLPRNRKASDLRQRLRGTGFVILADVPNVEVVIGVAGRFWRPDGGRCMELTADDFAEFRRCGFVKATWNFKLWSSRLVVQFFRRRRGSSASDRAHCGNFESIGPSSARSLDSFARRFLSG